MLCAYWFYRCKTQKIVLYTQVMGAKQSIHIACYPLCPGKIICLYTLGKEVLIMFLLV